MATFTNVTKNSATAANIQKSTSGATYATAGMYYGFGLYTYSGGEILTTGSSPTYTNLTKTSTTYTNVNKS